MWNMQGTDGQDQAYGELLADRVKPEVAQTFFKRDLGTPQLSVTEIADRKPTELITPPAKIEDAFVAILHITAIENSRNWEGLRQSPVRTIPQRQILICDLKRSPSVLINQPHHCIHFYMPRLAFDLVADDLEAQRIDDLAYRQGEPYDDPIIRGLGFSIHAALERPEQANRLFLDHVMMAVTTHVAQTYGGLVAGSRQARGGLAGWQERRAKDLLSSDLSGQIPLQEVASACGLSMSHFSRAFRVSTGVSPHQWLLQRRVDVAKAAMLDSAMPLSEVALACGFADQSHFTRVFSKVVGVSPGTWRRQTGSKLKSRSQNITVAASAMAERSTLGQRS